MFNFLAKALTIVLLIGVLLDRTSRPTPREAEPFHDRVREVVGSIPASFGAWAGREVPVPAPAQALLRPGALLARRYVHGTKGIEAELVIIHCRDTRDLAGHYPPNCYPAHGWRPEPHRPEIGVDAGDGVIPFSRYEFGKRTYEASDRLVVYGTFVIPGRGPVTSMSAVREAASDYADRLYGATQVQVIFRGDLGEAEEQGALREIITQALPVIRSVERRAVGTKP